MNAISFTVPVILITGALTGIGRPTALAFPRKSRLDDYFSFGGKA